MKTQLRFASGIGQHNIREIRRSPRLAAHRPRRSRLALESLESRALLTAFPVFPFSTWSDTVPEPPWMATCHAAYEPAATDANCDAQQEWVETVKTVCGDGATVCEDSKTVCEDSKTVCVESKTVCVDPKTVCTDQEVSTKEQDCTPSRSCDSAPPTECRKSDCQESTPQQVCQELREKIARLLRRLGCDSDYDQCETPKSNCESAERQSSVKRWGSSCNDDSSRNCDGPQADAQERRGYSNKTENWRVVDRCESDRGWSPSAAWTRHR
jgi:hypothetical protein